MTSNTIRSFNVAPVLVGDTLSHWEYQEATPIVLLNSAWHALELGSLVEVRLPDPTAVVAEADKKGIILGKSQVTRSLEGFLYKPLVLDGVPHWVAFGSGSTKDRRFMFTEARSLPWLEKLFTTAEKAFSYGGFLTANARKVTITRLRVMVDDNLVAEDNILVESGLSAGDELGFPAGVAQARLAVLENGRPVALAKGQFVEAVDDEVLHLHDVDMIIHSSCIKAGKFEAGKTLDMLVLVLNVPEVGMSANLDWHGVALFKEEELSPVVNHGRRELKEIAKALDGNDFQRLLELVGEELSVESKTILGAVLKTGAKDIEKHPALAGELQRAIARRQMHTLVNGGVRVPTFDLLFDTVSVVVNGKIRHASGWIPKGYFLGGPEDSRSVMGRCPILHRQAFQALRKMDFSFGVKRLEQVLGISRRHAELVLSKLQKPGVVIMHRSNAAESASDGDYDLMFSLAGNTFDTLWRNRHAEAKSETSPVAKNKSRLHTPYAGRFSTAIRVMGSFIGQVDFNRYTLVVNGLMDQFAASVELHQNTADAVKFDIPDLETRVRDLAAHVAGLDYKPEWMRLTKSSDLRAAVELKDVRPTDMVGQMWNQLVPLVVKVADQSLPKSNFVWLGRWSESVHVNDFAAALVSAYNANIRRIMEMQISDDERAQEIIQINRMFRATVADIPAQEKMELFLSSWKLAHSGQDRLPDGKLIRAAMPFRVFPTEAVQWLTKAGGRLVDAVLGEDNVARGVLLVPEVPATKGTAEPIRIYIGAAGWRQAVKEGTMRFQDVILERQALIGKQGVVVEAGKAHAVVVNGKAVCKIRDGKGEAGEIVLISNLSGNPWALTLSVIGKGETPQAPPTSTPSADTEVVKAKSHGPYKIGIVGITQRGFTPEQVLAGFQIGWVVDGNKLGVPVNGNWEEVGTFRVSPGAKPDSFQLDKLNWKATERSLNAVVA